MRPLLLLLVACVPTTEPEVDPTPTPAPTPTPGPAPESLQMRPALLGPQTPVRCDDQTGAARSVQWEVDGVAVDEAEVLEGPHPIGSVLTCRVGEVSDSARVTTGAFGGNVLFVLLDDVGLDKVPSYDHGTRPPPLPTIDGIADEGLQFRFAYTNPTCSPTRATVLTGQHAMHHGIGRALDLMDPPLPAEAWTLAEAMRDRGYATAAFGKWHLGAPDGEFDTVRTHGFDHFAGSPSNLGRGQSTGYDAWVRVEDGVSALTTTYATTDSIDSTLAFVDETDGPWFVWLALHAAHTPFHAPPDHLNPRGVVDTDSSADLFDAMLMAADLELGRLLDGIDLDNTTVIVMGDNGTPDRAVRPPLSPDHAKATPYEGGIHVPLLIRSPFIHEPGRATDALVQSVDVFPTLLEMTGLELPPTIEAGLDGRSFLPLMSSPAAPDVREWVYVEGFQPVFSSLLRRDNWNRVVRDRRWKYIQRIDGLEELYDLGDDFMETANLTGGGRTVEGEALDALQRLRAVVDSELPAVEHGVRLTETEARAALDAP